MIEEMQQFLRASMRAKGWSDVQLAEAMGVTRRLVASMLGAADVAGTPLWAWEMAFDVLGVRARMRSEKVR